LTPEEQLVLLVPLVQVSTEAVPQGKKSEKLEVALRLVQEAWAFQLELDEPTPLWPKHFQTQPLSVSKKVQGVH